MFYCPNPLPRPHSSTVCYLFPNKNSRREHRKWISYAAYFIKNKKYHKNSKVSKGGKIGTIPKINNLVLVMKYTKVQAIPVKWAARPAGALTVRIRKGLFVFLRITLNKWRAFPSHVFLRPMKTNRLPWKKHEKLKGIYVHVKYNTELSR